MVKLSATRTLWIVAPAIVSALVAVPACTDDVRAGSAVETSKPPPDLIASPDAEPQSKEDAGLVEYCESTTCRFPRTTCPTSRFACDVDLMNDRDNCGACGFKCPYRPPYANYACVNGKCEMSCSQSNPWTADCNGIIDDQCEIQLGTNTNCNACGDTCPDPTKPCIFDTTLGTGHCGCDPGQVYCPPATPFLSPVFYCFDEKSSDSNCGGCGITCDPAGNGAQQYDNTYYGCADGACGAAKCKTDYEDCDHVRDNGCEVHILDDANCGGCGVACDPGQTCTKDINGKYFCACPGGQTLCPNPVACVDTGTDARNCGGCGIDCRSPNYLTEFHGDGYCNYGTCDFSCRQGWGDCNTNSNDGCETNLNSDPRNCGACGHSCDLLGNQPCILGQCAVEACDGGGVPH